MCEFRQESIIDQPFYEPAFGILVSPFSSSGGYLDSTGDGNADAAGLGDQCVCVVV